VKRVVHVPTLPGKAQLWHPSVQGWSQHTPSVQLPRLH
jgi:hypothetical protein